MMRMVRMMAPVLLLSAVLAGLAGAQTGNPPTVAPAATAINTAVAQPFDVKAAVDAYLAKVPREQRARSDAYFEGGYCLILWDFLSTAVVMWLLLRFRWSARMRDLAERITRFRPLQSALYWFQFLIVTSLLTFPLTVYEGYFREHKYGLSNQTFGPWMRDQAVMLAVGLVLGAPLIMALFGVVRRLGKNWWVWGAVVAIAFFAFVDLIAPVYIFPLFNTYTKLQDPHVNDPILSMARANGIPASEVYVFDASRQTKRIGANVSGFAGTMRISLNDNLLNRCTLPEIEATMGHEMGHYVMNHQYKGLVFEGVLTFIGFAFLKWGLNACLARWGQSWGVRGITDVAIIPVAALILSVYTLVLTPVENTITRTMEYEADIFGLNASQQPDGEAEIDLKLGEYRKLDPGPAEEFIFFDHPSGRTRITAAMRWKAEHLQPAQVQLVSAKP
ncbi:MAG TPA: M48 family metallopeptidase [Terriglobales bacterium]|nr:M48 family metallopeptidase [Terriglobales bacterium]